MHDLNRAAGAIGPSAGPRNQFVQTNLSHHSHLHRSSYRTRNRSRLTALSVRDAHAYLRILNILGIGPGDVLLHFFIGTTLGTNRRLQERQRRDVAVRVYFYLRAEIGLAKYAYVQDVARAKQIISNTLVIDRCPGRAKDRTLRLLLRDREHTQRETYENRCENQTLNTHDLSDLTQLGKINKD